MTEKGRLSVDKRVIMRLALTNYINHMHSSVTGAENTQFCDWWVDSPHSFGDLVVLREQTKSIMVDHKFRSPILWQ